MSTFEDIITREGHLVYTNVGRSMMPLLRQGRDLMVIVSKPEGRLKRYDIPLYKRDDGKYILHRILRVRPNDYVLCGDNQWRLEKGITDRHIIGVLQAVVRDGKTIPVTDRKMRLYAHLWCDFYPVRAAIFWIRDLGKRLRRFKRL
ncbi:MAG: S24/S26 family peptidase [Bacteroidales bacterium]|nr:S24/S26 family peptidase [Bacteroidales bacterium]